MQRTNKTMTGLLVIGLAAAVAGGFLLREFWSYRQLIGWLPPEHLGPDANPTGLEGFLVFGVPCLVYLPTVVLALLGILLGGGREDAGDGAWVRLRQYLVLDAVSYLALPAAAVILSLWSVLGNGYLALGAAVAGLITYKAALILSYLWRELFSGPEPSPRPAWARRLAVFLAATAVFGMCAVWVGQALSTAGDEVSYLLLSHSLTTEGSLDVSGAVERGEWRQFYWGNWHDEMAHSLGELGTLIYPLVLAPAYWLGGRLGVLLFNALAMGLVALLLLDWLESLGLERRSAAVAVFLALLAAPVFVMAQMAWPDTLGMLLFVAGLRLAAWGAGRYLKLAGLLAITLLLYMLKTRLAPLGAGLVLAWVAEQIYRAKGMRAVLLCAAGAVVAAVAALALGGSAVLPGEFAVAWDDYWSQVAWWQPLWTFARGMSLDQNYGVLFAAPALLLALAGLPITLRRHPWPAIYFLGGAAGLVGALIAARFFVWYGGFAGPGRFIAAMLPGAALLMALPVCLLSRRPAGRALFWLLAVPTLAYTWLLNLYPLWRFGRPNGQNPLLAALAESLNLELTHLFPSNFTLSPHGWLWLTGAVVLAVGLAVWFWRDDDRACEFRRLGLETVPVLALILALLLGSAGVYWAAKANPPGFTEAEHPQVRGGRSWSGYDLPGEQHGRVIMPGERLEVPLHLPGGSTVLTVTGSTNRRGTLTLKDGGRDLGAAEVDGDAERVSLAATDLPAGRRRLELIWQSDDPDAYLLVDRLEAAPAGG